MRQVSGFDLSPLDKLRSPGYAQIDMAADLVRQLSQPFRALEFDFRQNNRAKLGIDDVARADRALIGVKGKRLTYRTPDSLPAQA